jgi:hypothetical protein
MSIVPDETAGTREIMDSCLESLCLYPQIDICGISSPKVLVGLSEVALHGCSAPLKFKLGFA